GGYWKTQIVVQHSGQVLCLLFFYLGDILGSMLKDAMKINERNDELWRRVPKTTILSPMANLPSRDTLIQTDLITRLIADNINIHVVLLIVFMYIQREVHIWHFKTDGVTIPPYELIVSLVARPNKFHLLFWDDYLGGGECVNGIFACFYRKFSAVIPKIFAFLSSDVLVNPTGRICLCLTLFFYHISGTCIFFIHIYLRSMDNCFPLALILFIHVGEITSPGGSQNSWMLNHLSKVLEDLTLRSSFL
ncbi:hypothetical protein ACJX0J_021592, partial [Zea mays]